MSINNEVLHVQYNSNNLRYQTTCIRFLRNRISLYYFVDLTSIPEQAESDKVLYLSASKICVQTFVLLLRERLDQLSKAVHNNLQIQLFLLEKA